MDSNPYKTEPIIVRSVGRNPDNPSDRSANNLEQRLEVQQDGISNTLTTVQKDNYVLEASAIRMVRNDEGKRLRKQYEAHEIKHGFNEYREPKIKDDGCCNTISTVQKDNYVLEQRPVSTKGKELDVASTILSGYHRTNMTGFNADNGVICRIERDDQNMDEENVTYRIRKLTPKECFRLMGVKDEDYEKLTVSNTQKYKQAGNSIVVDVLMAIFDNMFVQECKSNKLF